MSTVDVPRSVRVVGFVVVWGPVSLLSSYAGARLGGAGSHYAWGSAAVEAALSCAVFSAFFWHLGSGVLVSERRIGVLSLVGAVQTAAVFAWVDLRHTHLYRLEIVLLVPVGLVAAFWGARRGMRSVLPDQLRQRLDTRSLTDAEEAVRRCERLLADGSALTGEQRVVVQLNLAWAAFTYTGA